MLSPDHIRQYVESSLQIGLSQMDLIQFLPGMIPGRSERWQRALDDLKTRWPDFRGRISMIVGNLQMRFNIRTGAIDAVQVITTSSIRILKMNCSCWPN